MTENKKIIQNYEDLNVYKKSYQAALDIYETMKQMPKEELFNFTSQLKRASVSIPLNIAEGYGKRADILEFKRFLKMAKGSCDEMKVLIDFSFDLKYITSEQKDKHKEVYEEIGKMLYSLINNWK